MKQKNSSVEPEIARVGLALARKEVQVWVGWETSAFFSYFSAPRYTTAIKVDFRFAGTLACALIHNGASAEQQLMALQLAVFLIMLLSSLLLTVFVPLVALCWHSHCKHQQRSEEQNGQQGYRYTITPPQIKGSEPEWLTQFKSWKLTTCCLSSFT